MCQGFETKSGKTLRKVRLAGRINPDRLRRSSDGGQSLAEAFQTCGIGGGHDHLALLTNSIRLPVIGSASYRSISTPSITS